jgi:imidazolonepropionase-like amidohydrolase
MLYITNARIWTEKGFIDNAGIAVATGRIKAVGKGVTAPAGAKSASFGALHEHWQHWCASAPFWTPDLHPPRRGAPDRPVSDAFSKDIRISAKGLTIFPGLIDAHCHLGCFEDGVGPLGFHGNELTDPNTAHLDIKDSIFPRDLSFPDARAGGVTTTAVFPGSGNLIGGLNIVMKTAGRTVDELVLVHKHSMKMALGENPFRVYGSQGKSPSTRFGNAGEIRKAFAAARNYLMKRRAWEAKSAKERAKAPFDFDVRNENLALVLERKIGVRFHVHRADDIHTALRLSREIGFDITIDHCTEGHLIPDLLKQYGVAAVIGPIGTSRVKYELRERSTKTCRVLYEHGVPFAICTDHPVIPIQQLSICAALAVREGLPEEAALNALTIGAARILKIDKRLGSLQAGKDADFCVVDGHILDTRDRVKATFIDGNCAYAE